MESAFTTGNMVLTSIETLTAHGVHYAHPTPNVVNNIVARVHSHKNSHAPYEHFIQSSK